MYVYSFISFCLEIDCRTRESLLKLTQAKVSFSKTVRKQLAFATNCLMFAANYYEVYIYKSSHMVGESLETPFGAWDQQSFLLINVEHVICVSFLP